MPKCSELVNYEVQNSNRIKCLGGIPIMTEITRMLVLNTCRQVFSLITTTKSTRCLVEKFKLICYSQRVNTA